MKDDILVFDTGPLNHFARESWLGVLKAVVGSCVSHNDWWHGRR